MRRAVLDRAPPVLFLLVVLATWHMATVVRQFPEVVLPPPIRVLEEFVTSWQLGLVWDGFAYSARSLVVGLTVPIVIGIVVGIAMGASPLFSTLAKPYLWALFATPGIAILPLFILWFGIGDRTTIALIFISALLPMTLACADGVRTVDPALLRVARAFGAGKFDIARRIVLPALLPSIGIGLRVAVSRGFVALLFVEMLLSTGGLGTQVMRAARAFNTPRMMAFVFSLIVLGIALITLTRSVERYLSRWRDDVTV